MYAFINANVFDGRNYRLLADRTVLVRDDRIVDISCRGAVPAAYRVIDCGGRTLMPGLIDAHVHVYASDVNLVANDTRPLSYVAQHAHRALEGMLSRGFTTVRDCGGADHGLAQALNDGLVAGPRLFHSGKLLSQSGGHGDLRHPGHGDASDDFCLACGCGHVGHLTVTADGVDQVRRAARENFRRGASFIKFAASGGVSSLSGSVTALQYSDEEVRAIVDEATRHERYCTAHAHPDKAIRRAIELGVHCIEHASMIGAETARMAADCGTYIVPTLAIAQSLLDEGSDLGLSYKIMDKLRIVMDGMLESLEQLRRAGAIVGFGTDLLGTLQKHQCREFALRAQVFTPAEILRQATSDAAKVLGAEHDIGRVEVGAFADLLVLEGNPLEDITLLQRDGENLDVIMKAGVLHRQTEALLSNS